MAPAFLARGKSAEPGMGDSVAKVRRRGNPGQRLPTALRLMSESPKLTPRRPVCVLLMGKKIAVVAGDIVGRSRFIQQRRDAGRDLSTSATSTKSVARWAAGGGSEAIAAAVAVQAVFLWSAQLRMSRTASYLMSFSISDAGESHDRRRGSKTPRQTR